MFISRSLVFPEIGAGPRHQSVLVNWNARNRLAATQSQHAAVPSDQGGGRSIPNQSVVFLRQISVTADKGFPSVATLIPPRHLNSVFQEALVAVRSLGRDGILRQNLLFSCHAVSPQLDFFHATMARARASEHQRPRSKTALIEQATFGITKLQEVLAAINDLSQEGFPYRDAAQSKAELQFRECLRQSFGERSHEFQMYRNFKIRTADKDEVAQILAVIKDLIHTLEDRKLELQGLKQPPQPEPSHEANVTNTARLVFVSPTTPTIATAQAAMPMTVAVAMTTNVGPSISLVTPTPQTQPIAPAPQIPTPILASTPTSIPAPTPLPIPTAASTPISTSIAVTSESHAPLIPAPSTNPSPPPESTPFTQPMPLTLDGPKQVLPSPAVAPASPSIPVLHHTNTPASALSAQSIQSEATHSVVPAPQDPQVDKQSISVNDARLIESALDTAFDQDTLQLIRKVCHRFHAVARHLRLRRDYRPTLEVEDDHDLQDLLCALLKVEFEEVATEEWTPPYTEGAPRTTLLVNRDQIAVVAKKTRSGLTMKELADQVAADSAYYSAQGRCSTLFCFMYDPEGRIGSPKRLETTLTSVSEHCRVEVLVAPK